MLTKQDWLLQPTKRMTEWFNAPFTFWLVLAWPSFPLVKDLFENNRYYPEIMHLTGVLSSQMLVLTLAISPLTFVLKRWSWGQILSLWLLKRRRYLGVAAFGYGFLHLVFYIRETYSLELIYLEFFDLDFFLGWIGILFLLPAFLTSNRQSVSLLKNRWKMFQRLSYIAVIGIFIHWLCFDTLWEQPLFWLAILCAVKAFHIIYRLVSERSSGGSRA